VDAGDVLEVQEGIARSVAGNLELNITAYVAGRLADRRSRSAEAQRLYTIAKGHAQKFDAPSNERAVTIYRQALEIDPDFALAQVWLAHAILNQRYFDERPVESLSSQIEPLLANAAKLAPELVDLYVVRGSYFVELRQRESALRDLGHALELSPNSRGAAGALGFYHLTNGEPRDALTYYETASALDPRDFGMHAYRCMALADLAQFGAAKAACETARAIEPESPWGYDITSQMEAGRGHLEEALRWSDAALTRGGDIAAVQGDRARWLVRLGLVADAGRVFNEALAVNAQRTRRNPALVSAGALAAISAGGVRGYSDFLRDQGLRDADSWALLFELANAALVAGDAKLAREFTDRALASKDIRNEDVASPWQARTGRSYLLIIAQTLRLTGDVAGADRRLAELDKLLLRLRTSGLETAGQHELEAQLAAMRGQGDVAMGAMQRAVRAGWSSIWLAEHEPYLAPLRQRADFRTLIENVGRANDAMAARLRARLIAPVSTPG
jgi:tetratricopeptide (TPR) repeat protein